MRRRAAAGLLLVPALAAAACARRESVLLDLAARAGAADHVREYTFALLGPPSGEPMRGPGLLRDGAAGLPRVLSRRASEVLLSFRSAAPRVAVLDVETPAGVSAQSVKLHLDQHPLGELALEPGRHRYRVELPVEAQKAGANRLALVFREAAPGADGRVAAYLYAVAAGAPGDPALRDLTAPGAPPPFAIESSGGRLRLVQAGAGAVRWAFRLPAGAELRTQPSLAPGAHGRVRFRVVLETDAGARELWAREIGATEAHEIRVPLPGAAGTPATLSLEIEGGAGAWGRWEAPRIVSPNAPEPTARPAAPETGARLHALRRDLAGASVLLVILDAARAQQFGCYGYPRPTTPEIDRIAREGVVFERAYAPAVYTLASMASLWTSLHPDEHGAGVEQGVKLGKAALTLAERLEGRGVATGGFVANGMAGPAFGLERGFSRFVEVFRGHGAAADSFRFELWPWLAEHKGARFFAYAHYREPHFPYDAPASFMARFGPDAPLPREAKTQEGFITRVNWGGRELSADEQAHLVRLYDANLAYADSEIGALRRHLEGLGVWERLLVIVTADHGEALYEHDGFVGHNQQLYEPSVHIPLIVRFPGGRGPAGRRISALVDTLDVAPTVVDAMGLPAEAAQGMGGRSLLPVALGAPGHEAVYSRTTGERPRYMLRDARYKYVYHSRFGPEELYDLEQDPGEAHDLSAGAPVLTALYRQRLAEWLLGLRRRQGETVAERDLTPEQRENLKALGYVQ